MQLLIRNAMVLAMDAAHGTEPFRADVLVDGELIADIGEITPPDGATVLDGTDRLVMPGIVNAHLHSLEVPFRGRYDGLPLELWMLLAYPILGLLPTSPRLAYLRTLVVGIESLKNGVTSVVDDLANPLFERLTTVFDAYEELGIRASVSGNVMDRYTTATMPYVRDLLPPELLEEEAALPPATVESYLAFSDAVLAELADRPSRLRYVVAPSAPQRCSSELLVAAMEYADAHDTTFHIHVLETKMQAVTGTDFYGTSLVAELDRVGALTPRTTMAHGIWLTDADIERIAERGSCVVHNPISNQKLGAGIQPFRELRDAGVEVALGTDGMSTNDSARMFDVMKSAALLHHVSTPDGARWPRAAEVLHAATIGGARSANLHDVSGSIEVGKQADLVVLDLRTSSFTPLNDVRNHLVYCENGASIEYVLVAGEIVVDHGRVTTVDEAAILEEFRSHMPTFLDHWAQVEELNRRFLPAFRAVYERCSDTDVGLNRYSRTLHAAEMGS